MISSAKLGTTLLLFFSVHPGEGEKELGLSSCPLQQHRSNTGRVEVSRGPHHHSANRPRVLVSNDGDNDNGDIDDEDDSSNRHNADDGSNYTDDDDDDNNDADNYKSSNDDEQYKIMRILMTTITMINISI